MSDNIAEVVVTSKHRNGEFVEGQATVHVKCEFAEFLVSHLPSDLHSGLGNWSSTEDGHAFCRSVPNTSDTGATKSEQAAHQLAHEINTQADTYRRVAEKAALKGLRAQVKLVKDDLAHCIPTNLFDRELERRDTRINDLNQMVTRLYEELGLADW